MGSSSAAPSRRSRADSFGFHSSSNSDCGGWPSSAAAILKRLDGLFAASAGFGRAKAVTLVSSSLGLADSLANPPQI